MTNINQGFPQVTVPIAQEGGLISYPWYQFLSALWLRTGGPSTAGQILSIATTGGVTGGPANLANPNTTFSLVQIGDGQVLSNISGGTTTPSGHTVSGVFDHVFGTTQGSLLIRGASLWAIKTPGSNGQILTISGGVPVWASAAGVAGTLLGVQIFSSHGSNTYTPTAGTNSVVVWLTGAGGGGGGAITTAAGAVSIGGGGGAGATVIGQFTSGFSGATLVVGQGGAGGSGAANGGNGTASTFINAGHLSAGGGTGGLGNNLVNAFPAWDTNSPAAGGTTSGSGALSSGQGGDGEVGLYLNATQAMTTRGGISFWGTGPVPTFTAGGTNAPTGGAPGAGGSGAANTQSIGATHSGSAGQDGYAIVWEYT